MAHCSCRRKYKSHLRNNCTNMKLSVLKEILHMQKSRKRKGRGTWRIVPKDSIEIQKNRQRSKNKTQRNGKGNYKNKDSRNGSLGSRRTGSYKGSESEEDSLATSITSLSSFTSMLSTISQSSSCSSMDY